MDEVDIENADELNELEARLYAQIHHEPSGDFDSSSTYKETAPSRQVTATSVVNTSFDRTRGRYWNEKPNYYHSPRPTNPKFFSPGSGALNNSKQQQRGVDKNKPVETNDKTFQPPVKNLSNLRANPFASGNGPKTKGSLTQPRGKHANNEQFKRLDLRPTNKGLFGRQQNKLANAVKYDNKKQKAKAAKAKMNTKPGNHTIEILSESDTDDVIEVPVPSPKIVTIDTSTDEENEPVEKEAENFLKPEALVGKENSSRCTSPCSVISDDFIGHKDRSRLLEETSKADDEDLLMLELDVDSLMEIPEKSADDATNSQDKQSQNKSAKASTDYTVTQSDFRALDVYESESDIQESVYSKGSKKSKPSIVVNLEHESSSDDIEEIDISQKTKRRTKRRSLSCNKDTDTHNCSSDSEEENKQETDKPPEVKLTRIPHIAFGEAIEKNVTSAEILNKSTKENTSDNEFIANLNTLAQGASASVIEPEKDSDEELEITARAIAESVLSKSRAMDKTTTSTTTASTEPVTANAEEANDALPENSLQELDQIFSKIDNMDKKAPSNVVDSDSDSDESVKLVAPTSNKRNHLKSKIQKETNDPVYNIVYSENVKVTEGCGIGWTEEMRKFYNESWKGERFNVKAICAQMRSAKSLWKIYTDDRFPKYRKYSHQKCMNCCEFGHIRSKCPRPKKIPVCYMCGEKGHSEPRCPNTICLRCGNKTRMYTKSCNACNYQNRLICPICKVRGHNLNLCPDKWRRYHSTTKPNEYPNNKVEYKHRKLCCICGLRGHLGENCRNAIHFAEYPMCVSEIRSHQKSYDDISVKSLRSGIGYNLMYKPDEDISFELAENKTTQQYYGRFLNAVGLGYLLSRKRVNDTKETDEPEAKQKRVDSKLKEYVVNPFGKAALQGTPAKPLKTQVEKEISIEIDEETNNSEQQQQSKESLVINDDAKEEGNIEMVEPSTSKSVAQTPRKDNTQSVVKKAATTPIFKAPDSTPEVSSKKNSEAVDNADSDSNYSFSEHFETNENQNSNPRKIREMDPLPDFIPIVDDEDMFEDDSEEQANESISENFVSIETEEEEENSNQLPKLPCEAKIYLTTFHSKFLLSPDGNKFLIEKSTLHNIKSKLEWTSVGHILLIFGQRCNQDKFHIELLHKFRELSEKMNRNQLENSQKVPRKREALIKFLRENINQLLTVVGNPNELFKRLCNQEAQQTKTGWKSAEKTRRLLNMILIGQAGLQNGSIHLDQLLSHLRILINDYKQETVINEVRDKIDSHWRLIFSSYRHEKYSELVEAYNNMPVKNRLQNINIDPNLLGKVEKGSDANNVASASEAINTPSKLVPNPLSIKALRKSPKTPVSEKKRPKSVSSQIASAKQKTPNQQHQQERIRQKAINPSPIADKIKAVNKEWEVKCANLLNEIDEKDSRKIRGEPNVDSKSSSMFWSREALKYIDECIELGRTNIGFLEKLSRVQIKSQKGLLSYNDYRAIIKIHNAIKSKH